MRPMGLPEPWVSSRFYNRCNENGRRMLTLRCRFPMLRRAITSMEHAVGN